VKSTIGSAASSIAGFGVNSILNALGSWVSGGAAWLLGQIGKVITASTSIDLGASWFTAHYQIMAVLAAVVIVPMLLLGILQSIYRQNASTLARSVLVNVPLAILLTAVAVKLVQLGLSITDALCATISQGAGLDSGHFLAAVAEGLSVSSVGGQPAIPGFVMFVGGLAVVFGALMVWIELLIRAAAVYVAVLFLPLALASLAWPAISHWCRRLVDTLVALILGKFVIVAVLSLAAGALAGGIGSVPGHGGGFSAVLGGAALLLLAGFAPWSLFRLLPFLEAGAAGHLEALSHRARQTAGAPIKSLSDVALRSKGVSSLMGGTSELAKEVMDTMNRSGSGGSGTVGTLGVGSGGAAALGAGGSGPGRSGGSGGSGGSSGSGGSGESGGFGGSGGPEPEPSSVERTGVGSLASPGMGIPMWEPHPIASISGLSSIPIEEGGTGRKEDLMWVPPVPTQAEQSSSEVQSSTWERLGRDDLGPRLIASAPTLPAPPKSDPPITTENGRSGDDTGAGLGS
jgi:hypothetical protein